MVDKADLTRDIILYLVACEKTLGEVYSPQVNLLKGEAVT